MPVHLLLRLTNVSDLDPVLGTTGGPGRPWGKGQSLVALLGGGDRREGDKRHRGPGRAGVGTRQVELATGALLSCRSTGMHSGT